jgi:metallo-beta-lactamase class B
MRNLPELASDRGRSRLPASGIVLALAVLCAATIVAQDYPRTDAHRTWNQPAEPFRIVGPIHYVGTFDLASYLITTPAGHILIDTGLERSATQLEASIEKLGFHTRDIRILLNSQAHFDHAAGLAAMKKASGARMLASAADAEMLEAGGRGDFAFGDSLTFTPVKVDGTITHGQRITLGDVTLTAYLTPGHSRGTTTYTMSVRDGDRDLLVVFAGSTSVPNPDIPLTKNPTYPAIADDYKRTFAFLKSLKPDVFLTQHASSFGLHDKARRLRAGETPNPFIDPAGYAAWLTQSERSFLELLATK